MRFRKAELLVVQDVGYAVAHGWQKDIAHIDGVDRPNFDADLLAIGCHECLLSRGPARRLGFPAREFHAPTQLAMLVLPHFLSALLDDTRHERAPSCFGNLSNLGGNSKPLSPKSRQSVVDNPGVVKTRCDKIRGESWRSGAIIQLWSRGF